MHPCSTSLRSVPCTVRFAPRLRVSLRDFNKNKNARCTAQHEGTRRVTGAHTATARHDACTRVRARSRAMNPSPAPPQTGSCRNFDQNTCSHRCEAAVIACQHDPSPYPLPSLHPDLHPFPFPKTKIMSKTSFAPVTHVLTPKSRVIMSKM